MSRRRRPPKRSCRECGGEVYAWSEGPLCPLCVRATVAKRPAESLRDFRRRVIGGAGADNPGGDAA